MSELLQELQRVAPCVAFDVLVTEDEDAEWDVASFDGDRDDYTAWSHEVRATCIDDGQLLSASAWLGGTWEKYGDNPRESNPNISGYLPQLLLEAAELLHKGLVAKVNDRKRATEYDLNVLMALQGAIRHIERRKAAEYQKEADAREIPTQ